MPPDGGPGWQIGPDLWPENPRLRLPDWTFALAERWEWCRDGRGGFRHLPAAGGVGEQPAWLVDALLLFEAAFQAGRKTGRR